jgi:hypothetical protein
MKVVRNPALFLSLLLAHVAVSHGQGLEQRVGKLEESVHTLQSPQACYYEAHLQALKDIQADAFVDLKCTVPNNTGQGGVVPVSVSWTPSPDYDKVARPNYSRRHFLRIAQVSAIMGLDNNVSLGILGRDVIGSQDYWITVRIDWMLTQASKLPFPCAHEASKGKTLPLLACKKATETLSGQ